MAGFFSTSGGFRARIFSASAAVSAMVCERLRSGLGEGEAFFLAARLGEAALGLAGEADFLGEAAFLGEAGFLGEAAFFGLGDAAFLAGEADFLGEGFLEGDADGEGLGEALGLGEAVRPRLAAGFLARIGVNGCGQRPSGRRCAHHDGRAEAYPWQRRA